MNIKIWEYRGFVEHGLKDSNKTYFKNELSLLLDEAPSVTSRYREIITKTDNCVLFCLNSECSEIDEFIEALFWADINIEEDEDGVQYLIDFNKGLVISDFGLFYNDIGALFDRVKMFGGLYAFDYYSSEESTEIFNKLNWDRDY